MVRDELAGGIPWGGWSDGGGVVMPPGSAPKAAPVPGVGLRLA